MGKKLKVLFVPNHMYPVSEDFTSPAHVMPLLTLFTHTVKVMDTSAMPLGKDILFCRSSVYWGRGGVAQYLSNPTVNISATYRITILFHGHNFSPSS